MSNPEKSGYVVLQRFMIDSLGLTGDELIVYAIIYGFCQDGRSSCRCSRSYFAYWLGKSKTTVNRIIDSLVAKGCVVRSHEVVDGQTMPRYMLGESAPVVRPGRFEIVSEKVNSGPDGGYAGAKGGTPTYPPYQGENDKMPVGTGGTPTYPQYAGVPGVRGREPITDTDTETDTESDRADREKSDVLSDFNALKPFMPTTDGFSYGYGNYKALRTRGFSADEIQAAARKMTAALRANYPDRPAKFVPHAERLLDAANPQGIYAYLDRKKVAATREPTERDLFVFALTNDAGDLTREAFSLNDAIVKCSDRKTKEDLRRKRDSWIAGNRDRILELWRSRKGV